jgi:hypothetical protein
MINDVRLKCMQLSHQYPTLVYFEAEFATVFSNQEVIRLEIRIEFRRS